MAKEDFCFTYYDGDAARDKAHMSRLERGAYDDLISAQRKRGHLSLEDIKKVLSKDFDSCWDSMEWVLTKDNHGKFYIEWVDMSLEKMRRNSEKQKIKADKRWNKDTNSMPRDSHGINPAIPIIENEDGNEDGIKDEKEKSEKLLMPFTSESFRVLWLNWKKYRLQEFRRKYKSMQSEQAALVHLAKISGGIEQTAGEVISQSIANQWQGLFELKNVQHGQSVSKNGQWRTPEVSTPSAFSKIDSMPGKT